jgi:hypothetical protein
MVKTNRKGFFTTEVTEVTEEVWLRFLCVLRDLCGETVLRKLLPSGSGPCDLLARGRLRQTIQSRLHLDEV